MGTSEKTIALLGATSHIAKGLIYGFLQRGAYRLSLFARSPERVRDFLKTTGCNGDHAVVMQFDSFSSGNYDVVINCVGIGDPGKLRGAEASIFHVTETYDNLILKYLGNHPATCYINLSSGAVYGADFVRPATQLTQSVINVNQISPVDYYGIAKLHAEAKHRGLPTLHIIDIRVFSYFSRFVDLQTRFLMTDALNCLRSGCVFETGPEDIMRDYIHPEDLQSLMIKSIESGILNDVFDAYSREPISKFQILNFLAQRYGLQYEVVESTKQVSATGLKKNYYSTSMKASSIGYSPQYTSLDCIRTEMDALLKKDGANDE